MNEQLEKLVIIAQKPQRLIIGLMSGTSLDGLDIALCRISGSGRHTRLSVDQFKTVAYPPDFREQIKTIFAKRTVDFEKLCGLNALIGIRHAAYILETLKEWQVQPSAIDLIASHGQTVFHAPQSLTGHTDLPNSTLQIGDGDHIAVNTGIITISDFRQKHLAGGGEGAPLAAYGDYLLFSDSHENRVLLNIGGIANFTYLPASGSGVFSTDTGPGNTLMDQYMQHQLGKLMDTDAEMAIKGNVSEVLLQALLSNTFFELPLPRTTGPELFNLDYLERAQHQSGTLNLTPEDIMATLCAFSAASISQAVRNTNFNQDPVVVYASGGGLHNPRLMQLLKQQLPNIRITSFKELGLPPDAKEAALFALLANETIAGSPENASGISGSPAICMGKVSFPR
ncbi:anhydro-N-acetylmuramic acid kinase [bacterium A37T11]|nr:anhydro-N-acetylmuramic acid kinase [bacterium A37T11]